MNQAAPRVKVANVRMRSGGMTHLNCRAPADHVLPRYIRPRIDSRLTFNLLIAGPAVLVDVRAGSCLRIEFASLLKSRYEEASPVGSLASMTTPGGWDGERGAGRGARGRYKVSSKSVCLHASSLPSPSSAPQPSTARPPNEPTKHLATVCPSDQHRLPVLSLGRGDSSLLPPLSPSPPPPLMLPPLCLCHCSPRSIRDVRMSTDWARPATRFSLCCGTTRHPRGTESLLGLEAILCGGWAWRRQDAESTGPAAAR